jgi:hypothetical protein
MFFYLTVMEFLNKLREKSAVKKTEKFFPAFAFLGGFSWDSMTIGSKVYGTDLVILFLYYLLALVSIYFIATRISVESKNVSSGEIFYGDDSDVEIYQNFFGKLLNRGWSSAWIKRLTCVVQFCFGNLYSALVICYFKSSGSIASFTIVLILAALLVGNEFLKEKYENFGICLAFLCLLGTMFFNFLIPHLVHGMGPFWFFGLCWGGAGWRRRPARFKGAAESVPGGPALPRTSKKTSAGLASANPQGFGQFP